MPNLREILPHAQAFIPLPPASPPDDDFMTPPRPTSEHQGDSHLPSVPPFPQTFRGSSEDVQAAIQALEQHDEEARSEELIQTIAAAFEIDPGQLKRPALELNVRPPPGLTAAREPEGEGFLPMEVGPSSHTGLAQPSHARTANPFLGKSPGVQEWAQSRPCEASWLSQPVLG